MAKTEIRIDAITTGIVRVCTVLQLTDPSYVPPGEFRRPVVLGRSDWFDIKDALAHAESQSECFPAPQRFAVYDFDDKYVRSYQCGKEMPVFEVVA